MQTVKKSILSLLLALAVTLGMTAPAFAIPQGELEQAVNESAAYLLEAVKSPQVGSTSGEWAVIGLARSGYDVPQSYYDNYLNTVTKYVQNKKGVLDERKYTEYSRVILALTAIGADPTDVGGYDLTAPLGDFEATVWQGVNGPVWALIALDSGNYELNGGATRQMYVDEILDRQLDNGGWSLAAKGGEGDADADITAMALQALAKYRDQEKVKIIAPLLIVAVLAAAFWYGGNAPGLQGAVNQPSDTTAADPFSPAATPEPEETDPAPSTEPREPAPDTSTQLEETPEPADDTPEEIPPDTETSANSDQESSLEYSEAGGMEIDPETRKDKYQTDPVPEGKPLPVEPQDAVFSDTAYTCTLSVRCDTILDNMDWLNPEKVELVPEDGVIFPATEVTFYEGENVFNVLQRELKKAKIHMEFTDTPMYNSAYIEGINNLYEFDCGEQSGWMYSVNGWFPNYGCSRYQLQDGDVVEWVYTCELGADVDGSRAVGG